MSTSGDAGADAQITGDAQGGGDAGDAPTFAATVHPLLVAACQDCHADGGEAGDTQLLFTGNVDADHQSVSRFVDISAPAGSRLLSKLSGNGHGGGTVFAVGAPEYQIVLRWMQQGARP